MTFNELASKHRLGLLKFLMWKTKGDLSLSEDLCQITLIRAYSAFKELEDKEAFPAWIRRIATNALINHIHREETFTSLDDVRPGKLAIADDDQTFYGRMVRRQDREKLMTLVYELPTQQSKAMALRLFEDMSFKEIAEAMSVPYDTAKANYRHGMIKIEAILAKRGA